VNPVRRESRKIRIASAGFLAWPVLGQGTNALGSMVEAKLFALSIDSPPMPAAEIEEMIWLDAPQPTTSNSRR
jgi:hypothetical protein